jgi:hypothetical protein
VAASVATAAASSTAVTAKLTLEGTSGGPRLTFMVEPNSSPALATVAVAPCTVAAVDAGVKGTVRGGNVMATTSAASTLAASTVDVRETGFLPRGGGGGFETTPGAGLALMESIAGAVGVGSETVVEEAVGTGVATGSGAGVALALGIVVEMGSVAIDSGTRRVEEETEADADGADEEDDITDTGAIATGSASSK